MADAPEWTATVNEQFKTSTVTPRLNFEIPRELHEGLKVAAALKGVTVKLLVVHVLDAWLASNPDVSSFSYGGLDFGDE